MGLVTLLSSFVLILYLECPVQLHALHAQDDTSSTLDLAEGSCTDSQCWTPLSVKNASNSVATSTTTLLHYHPHLQRRLKEAPAQCPEINKELLDKYAKNNTIMVTIADSLMLGTFGMNWIQTVRNAGITYWMIAAADVEAASKLAQMGITQCFTNHLPKHVEQAADKYTWGSHRWARTTWHKVTVAKSIHDLGFHVIHSDLDSVWFKDALDYFLVRFPQPALLISTDKLNCGNVDGDDGPEKDISPHNTMNTGFYFLRNTPEGKLLMQKWIEWGERPNAGHDQDGLNHLLLSSGVNGAFTHPMPVFKPGVERIMYAIDGQVPISYLCTASFGHSYSYLIQKYAQVLHVPLYEVHFVWGWGNREGKRLRMREQMMYWDAPSYYQDRNYISIDLLVPQAPANFTSWTDDEAVLDRTEVMTSFHLQAIALQLQQLYYAFALAVALNRVLILPKIQCFCVRNWYYVYRCRIPSDNVSVLPYTCSISEILRSKLLVSTTVAGQKLRVREHSFLENPRTPQEVKDSVVRVTAGLVHNSTYGLESQHDKAVAAHKLKIPLGNDDLGLQQLLRGYDSTRVLHFTNPMDAFSGFSSLDLQKEFDAAMAPLGSKWCCRHPKVTERTGRPEGQRYVVGRRAQAAMHTGGLSDLDD